MDEFKIKRDVFIPMFFKIMEKLLREGLLEEADEREFIKKAYEICYLKLRHLILGINGITKKGVE